MNNQVSSALATLYPNHPEGTFPPDLYSLASSLNMKSNHLVQSLKPNEEPARLYICVLLAAEQLEATMNLPLPDTKKAPVAPRTFTKLVNLFRAALFPNSVQQQQQQQQLPATPTKKRGPRRRTPASSPVKVMSPMKVSPVKNRLMASTPGVGTGEGEGGSMQGMDLMAIANATDASLGLTNENQQDQYDDQQQPGDNTGNNGSKAGSPKKKKIVRGGPKSDDPRKSRVIEICQVLGIADNATDAIIRSYKQYNGLVKDRWGLLCGIIVVIASKAHPRLLETGTLGFYNKLVRMSHHSMNLDKLEEWVAWSERIINDQSWVKQVTNPRSKEANYRNKMKKYSSGIGNMITGTMSFNNQRKLDNYAAWRDDIIARSRSQQLKG